MAEQAHSTDLGARAVAETLEGRLPVQPHQRIYCGFWSFFWTVAALSSASYAYLVGTSLASLGNTWLGIGGYFIGTVIGMAFVCVAVGLPSFAYGLDTVDVAKAALGVRGSLVLMVAIVFSCVGWGNMLVAMTARSIGTIIWESRAPQGASTANEHVVVASGLVFVAMIWWLTLKGPRAVRRLNDLCVPGQWVVAGLLLALLIAKLGPATLAHANVPAGKAVTTDRALQLALAVEFGFNNAFTMVPFLGGLTRLARRRDIVVVPPVLGYSFGAAVVCGVAALAAAASGSTDPLLWMQIVAGPILGSFIMLFLVVSNIGALVTLMYLGCISIQQIGPLARLPWRITVSIIVAPSLVVAFRTQDTLDRVMDLLTYNGVMFVGVAPVLLVDYFVLHRQVIVPAHLFTRSRWGRYWYLGGINWVAMSVVLVSSVLYFTLFNPVTLNTAHAFRFIGATVPIVVCASVAYAVLYRLTKAGVSAGPPRDEPPVELSL